MANNATWDFANLNVVFGGHQITGFADGDSYTMDFDVDRFTKRVGNYGLGAWAKSNNFGAGGSFTLLSTSDDNTILQAFLSADEMTPGGVLVPLVALETGGILSHTGLFRITKAPSVSRGTDVPTTTWVIGTTRLIQVLGGSTPSIIIDSVAAAQAIVAAGAASLAQPN
jgi:hypothetical protein